MILLLVSLTAICTLLLVVIGYVQLLYQEDNKIRTRETSALDYFRNHLEPKLGLKPEVGAVVYSLAKHTLLLALPVLLLPVVSAPTIGLWLALVEALGVSFLLMIVSTYLLPHFLYRRMVGRWVLPCLPLLALVGLILRPVAAVLNFTWSLIDLRQPSEEEVVEATASENLDALITAGAEEGLIEEADRALIQSVVEFGDKTVREVMTPRPNVVAIGGGKSLEELRQLVIHEQYSRIPVFEGTIDCVSGFVHVRDMFELDPEARAARQARELARPIRVVPETKPVKDLLREMQADGAHMAVVVDEYGNTAGLVTMEDLVEEILGEIRDEHEPTKDIHQEGENCYVVSGSFDIDHLQELVNFAADADTESTTVGGLVTEWCGHVPHVGEVVERDGLRIEVLAADELRVEQVRISKSKPVTENAA